MDAYTQMIKIYMLTTGDITLCFIHNVNFCKQ